MLNSFAFSRGIGEELSGEAQPALSKYRFCKRLLAYATQFGVLRVFTFAAMVTSMRPDAEGRVFGAAIHDSDLDELKRWNVEILEDGNIGGLNGVFLGAASELGMKGACLLGEVPQLFAHVPFPSASLAVLKVFSMLESIEIDTQELAERTNLFMSQWSKVADEFEQWILRNEKNHEQGGFEPEFQEETDPQKQKSQVTEEEREVLERLFEEAKYDRAKAYELKQELDKLRLFKEYEDRFLDLFK